MLLIKVAQTYLYACWLCFWFAFFRMKDSTDFYDLPSHSHWQLAVGDNEKNKTIVIFVFIFIPKW